jgi:hypothetical protein
MRAGRLDRLIDIQRKTTTHSDSGATEIVWTNIAARRAASATPLRGDERFGDPQLLGTEQMEFRVRWSAELAALSPLDRIIYPAMDAGDSPPDDAQDRRFYDVQWVSELGRREGLIIAAVRRVDTAP